MLSDLEAAAEKLPIYEGIMPYGRSAFTEAGHLAMERWEKESCALRVELEETYHVYWVTKISWNEYYVFRDDDTNTLPGDEHYITKDLVDIFYDKDMVRIRKRKFGSYFLVVEYVDIPEAASAQNQSQPINAASSI
jgi:hypothetical protein